MCEDNRLLVVELLAAVDVDGSSVHKHLEEVASKLNVLHDDQDNQTRVRREKNRALMCLETSDTKEERYEMRKMTIGKHITTQQ